MKIRFTIVPIVVAAVLITAAWFSSCKKQDDSELTPAYIQIDTITLNATSIQGGTSHKITDAWIYVDDQPLGCFELPCKIPVLTTNGKHKISVGGGIKLNGIGATRVIYPFYKFYTDSFTLEKTQTLVINPVVSYFPDTHFPYLEDFASGATSLLKDPDADTGLVRIASGAELLDGPMGAMILPPGTNNAQVYTTSNLDLPGSGTNVCLELDYKCNYTFYAGLFINNPNEIIANQVIGLNPTEGRWNKIYVNLTPEVSAAVNANSFRVFFRVIKASADSMETATIYLDNIKVVTP